MAKDCKVAELLQVSGNNKRVADDQISMILANVCFEIMHDISMQIYKSKGHQSEYNAYCGVIFSKIKESIKQAHRADDYEDFCVQIEDAVVYVDSVVEKLSVKHPAISVSDEPPELLKEFRSKNKQIYKRFFIRKRKVRSNVRNKKR